MSLLQDITTGLDGKSYDVGRISAVVTVANAIGLSIYDVVWQHAHFDLQAYGIGAGALFAGLGALLKLKENSEPGSTQERAEDRADRKSDCPPEVPRHV